MSSIVRIGIMLAGIYAVVRYRYRIMNQALGNPWIRKLVIKISMKIPFIRSKMIQTAFR